MPKKDLTIKVWRFDDAPQKYRDLSNHGGDEDWLAFVPIAYFDDEYGPPGWIDDDTAFGWCCVSEHKIKTGIVYIGAHA